MINVTEARQRQTAWESTFRKRYPHHPVLTLVDGVLNLNAETSRAIEAAYAPFGDQAPLVSRARSIAHAVAGPDFQGIVAMSTNAALRAAPDNWQSVEIFRLAAAIDAALWAVLAQEQLKPAEYAALTRPCAVGIPAIKVMGGLPEKEEPVVVAEEVKVEQEVEPEKVAEVSVPTPKNGAFIASAQRWADANPDLYAEFVKSKMGYVGGAFSYTCEKVIQEAGHANDIARGQRTLGAFALLAEAAAEKSDRLAKIKIAAKWWDGRVVVTP
ncbi:MAG: hypothetical protein PVSMB1_04140 [Gemmatimonadaceae bacterium]